MERVRGETNNAIKKRKQGSRRKSSEMERNECIKKNEVIKKGLKKGRENVQEDERKGKKGEDKKIVQGKWKLKGEKK